MPAQPTCKPRAPPTVARTRGCHAADRHIHGDRVPQCRTRLRRPPPALRTPGRLLNPDLHQEAGRLARHEPTCGSASPRIAVSPPSLYLDYRYSRSSLSESVVRRMSPQSCLARWRASQVGFDAHRRKGCRDVGCKGHQHPRGPLELRPFRTRRCGPA